MAYGEPHGRTPDTFEHFGDLLRYLRLRARLSQRELSIAVGYSFAQISRLESGRRRPDPAVVAAVFLPALDVTDEPAWSARLLTLAELAMRQELDAGSAAAPAPALLANGARDEVRSAPGPADVSSTMGLLATKFYLPQVRPTAVLRPRLVRALDAALTVPLTLVAAPAGFGKTTLLTSWLASRAGVADVPSPDVAWLSLDASDDDPAVFLRYLVAALQRLLPAAGLTTLALLELPQLPALPQLLTPLLNDLVALPGPSVLLLDDYHLLADPRIHEGVLFVVDHAPPQLHLVVASRSEPPLPLARLRARHRLVEFRAAELRFSPAEAYAFVTATLGVDITAEQAAVLEARTEGWAAGLQLAGLALRGRQDHASFFVAFTGSHRYIADYLTAEVLERMPAHLRAFVLQTSILDRLCGSLCDAVLGIASVAAAPDVSERGDGWPPPDTAYSQLMLAELDQAHLFLVQLDDERRWFRYHHLFAELLKARLHGGSSADHIQLLHQRAAAWYEAQGVLAKAIEHALAGQQWERAAALIAVEAVPMAVRSQIHTVVVWLQQLPEAVVQAHPLLGHAHSLGLMLTGQFDAALAQLDRAEAALPAEPADDLARLARDQLAAQRGHIALMRGDAEQASRLLAHMQDAFPMSAASPGAQQMIDLARADAGVYRVAMDYQASGQVGSAVERRAEAAIAAAQRAGNRAAVLNGCTYLATVQQLGGRLRAALATYRRYEALIPHLDALHAGGMPAYQVGMGELHAQ